MTDLLTADRHFAFGKNWRSFLSVLDRERIAEAEKGLRRLFPEGLEGKSFLDIGSGSGLSSLAALRLGAARVVSVDIDADSVSATEALRDKVAPGSPWEVSLRSVFDLEPATDGTFDVVYSWGVLHHTGDMWRAVETAGQLVKPGGLYALALYHKTRMCGLWRLEKRLYSAVPSLFQGLIRGVYIAARFTADGVRGKRPLKWIREYKSKRGMSWSHDVHDWLGGYPYQSAGPEEVERRLFNQGFAFKTGEMWSGGFGLWGSGCNEFVFRRLPEIGLRR
jgi:2-polyprenyl-6-hydroxyphenyl methylase/3-demethylubiquinone-9 3-methyltransferase